MGPDTMSARRSADPRWSPSHLGKADGLDVHDEEVDLTTAKGALMQQNSKLSHEFLIPSRGRIFEAKPYRKWRLLQRTNFACGAAPDGREVVSHENFEASLSGVFRQSQTAVGGIESCLAS